MSNLITAPKGLLFASVIWNTHEIDISDFLQQWESRYGLSDKTHPSFNPSFDYYQKEMGEPLERLILYSTKHIDREVLVEAKKWATHFERENNKNSNRTINIDPGLLTLENMVLSTGKPYSHRIYLADGVYADLNYIYRNKSFQTLEWTYPDYAHEEKIQLFNKIRNFLLTK